MTKVILFGSSYLKSNKLIEQTLFLFESLPIPDSYPVTYMEFLGNVDLLIINTENCIHQKGLIAQLRSVIATPILVILPNENAEVAIEAFRAGANDVILYPFEEEELLNRIQKLHPVKIPEQIVANSFMSPAFSVKKLVDKLKSVTSPPLPEIKADLFVEFLGNFKVNNEDKKPIHEVLPARACSLLAYLLYHSKRKISREKLAEVLWEEEYFSDSLRNRLNVAIYTLRNKLRNFVSEKEVIKFSNNCYFINPDLDIYTDLDKFNSYQTKGKEMERAGNFPEAVQYYKGALQCFRGGFLENLVEESWIGAERMSLDDKNLDLLLRLSQLHQTMGCFDDAIRYAKQVLEKDDCIEKSYRLLMEVYLAKGEKNEALRIYNNCKQKFNEKMKTNPSNKVKEIYNRILTNN